MRPPIPLPRTARPGGYPALPVSPWDMIRSGLSKNSGALIGLGSGLLSQPNFNEALAMGGQGWAQGHQADAAGQQQSATQKWVAENFPKFANLPAAEGFQAAMKALSEQSSGSGLPANIREWEYYNKLSPEDKANYLRMKRANPYLDIGTGFVQPDPTNPGQPAGPAIEKDNFTPAYDSARGTGEGKTAAEVQAEYDSLKSKLPGLKSVIGELSQIAQTATYTVTGQLIDNAMREAGMEPREAAVARTKYIAMVDNQVLPLLRDTFGAAFTQKEGDTLRATLGDPNKSPAEKQVILEAFIEQKIRDLEGMQTRLPGQGGQSPAPVNNDPLGIR